MIKKLYAVYDKKAEMELGIIECPNDLVAIRDFSQACVNKDSQINKFAEDYELMYLGVIDTSTGIIESQVKTIAQASDYVNQ